MKNNKDMKKSKEVAHDSPTGSLVSFDEFDRFFDNFLSHRWPRFLDWNAPIPGLEKGFPKVDIIDHDKEIEVQAALPGVKKEDVDVTINHHTITIRTSKKEEKNKKANIFAVKSPRVNTNVHCHFLMMLIQTMPKRHSRTVY